MISEKIIEQASKLLKNHNIKTHELDAQLILSNIMKVNREYLIVNNKLTLSEKILEKYNLAIKRRIKREPVAYINGKKEFWSDNYLVNPGTLIPRPETEILIYKIINHFEIKKINILDIGTGTGCILLSILKEMNYSKGVGIDISPRAIHTAKINSKKLKLNHRAKFQIFDLSKFNNGKYDLIVSNPPYIPSGEIKNLSKDIINYEPLIALNGGVDGLDLIKKVIYKSNHLLKRNGILALEIGYGQHQKVSSILTNHKYRIIYKEEDFNRNVRCIISTKVGYS